MSRGHRRVTDWITEWSPTSLAWVDHVSNANQPGRAGPLLIQWGIVSTQPSLADVQRNAMALTLPDLTFVDPYGGLADLAARILRTPGAPQDSFSDDPLRMMRAARFAAQLDFAVAEETVAAIDEMAARLSIVSAERIRD